MNQVELPAVPILEARRNELRELCLRCHVRRLDLFGSAVTNRFDETHSDFDMLVTFDELSPGPYADAYFTLKQGLEEMLGREVDLVTASALMNPYFRRQVEAYRQTLFAAP